MSNVDLSAITLKRGSFSVAASDLPATSIAALLSRGLTHYLGNEQSSKVSSAFKDKPEAEATPEARAKALDEYVAEAVKALTEGTVGTSNRGPRGSTVETIARQIAETEVKDILKANKLTMPSGDKKVKFANGDEFNRNELIDRRLAKYGDRINAEAAKVLKAREAKAAKADTTDL